MKFAVFLIGLSLFVKILNDPTDPTPAGTCSGNPCACPTTGQTHLANTDKCYTPVAHCTTYHATNDACNVCETGYKGATCNECDTGYEMKDSRCYTQGLNCEVYNPLYDGCYKCPTGKHFGTGSNVYKCFNDVPNCLTHTDDACTRCKVGFKVDNNACAQCTEPTPTSDGSTCQSIKTECAQHELTDDPSYRCKKCNANFYLKDNGNGGFTCDACSSSGDVRTGDYCYDSIADCTAYSSDGSKCTACGNSKVLAPGSQQCVACNTAGEKVINGFCYTVVDDCEEYNKESGYCGKCGNYMKVNPADNHKCSSPCISPNVPLPGETMGICGKSVDHCAIYLDSPTATSTCKTCQSGYILTEDDTCVSATCNTNTGGGNTGGNTGGDPKKSAESGANIIKSNIMYIGLILCLFL